MLLQHEHMLLHHEHMLLQHGYMLLQQEYMLLQQGYMLLQQSRKSTRKTLNFHSLNKFGSQQIWGLHIF